MTQNVVLDKGSVAIEPFFDATQEMLGAATSNFRLLVASSTTLTAEAGTVNDQASISIEGKYRFRTTSVTVSHPGGAAGSHSVYVTASANDFTNPPPNIDATDYNFNLVILTSGTPGGVAHFRKVGEVDWDGTKITHVRQLVGLSRSTSHLNPQARVATAVPLRVTGAASQTANLSEWQNSAGTNVASISPAGLLTTASHMQPAGSVLGALNIYANYQGANQIIFGTVGSFPGFQLGLSSPLSMYREDASTFRFSAGLKFDGNLFQNSGGASVGFFGRTPTVRNATSFTNGTGLSTSQFDLPAGFTMNQLASLVMTLIKTLGSTNGYGLVASAY